MAKTFKRMHNLKKKFIAIAIISNPMRFNSRYALFQKFHAEMEKAGAQLVVVEMAYGDRPFEVTEPHNPWHLRLRSWEELWHKENMINLGIQHAIKLAPDAEYFAWLDADISFVSPDWIEQTIHKLQHHYFVQMFETAIDLGPNGEAFEMHQSFMSQYVGGKPYCYGQSKAYSKHWHPGYCWAARREALDMVGGLIDRAILGAGDNHMAHALVGMLDATMSKGLHPNYIKFLNHWQERAERYLRRDVGFVRGTIMHYWHGKKANRGYHDRWQILVNNRYNPEVDVKLDAQGLLQLHDHGNLRSIHLRDQIRAYFHNRLEDSIDRE